MQTGYFTVCNPEPDSSSPEDDPRGIFSRYLGVHRVRGLRAAKERFHQNNPTQTLSNMPFTLTHLERGLSVFWDYLGLNWRRYLAHHSATQRQIPDPIDCQLNLKNNLTLTVSFDLAFDLDQPYQNIPGFEPVHCRSNIVRMIHNSEWLPLSKLLSNVRLASNANHHRHKLSDQQLRIRMSRKVKTEEESKNMPVSYLSEFRSGGQTQTLPPFRDLLPQHLHEEIDSTPFYSPTSYHLPGTSYVSSAFHPRSTRGANLSRSLSTTKIDSYDGYLLRTDRFSKDQSQGGVAPLKRQASDTEILSATNPTSHFSSGGALPPIRNLQPLPANIGPFSRVNVDTKPPALSLEYHSNSNQHTHSFGSKAPGTYLPASRPFLVIPTNTLSHSEPARISQPYESSRYGPYQQSFRPELDYSPVSAGSLNDRNYGAQGEPIDPKNKKRRGNLPKSVTDVLRAWFHEHLDHPYPSEEDKQMFISRTGLTISQISNWFINARRRQLPALRNQVRASEPDRNGHRQSPLSDNEQTSSQSSVSSHH
ncbi:uncharacterized protein PADG_02012 [Paracoccidioides brasiliensis Pb18]|uniref:Homeobox domain-containing protein n=2 Tax=Paracoccidioides brasiliensis TaxID=121759 RepID=C1G4Z6_PARBD|nr:uncharacterized protein PADG_02012 [Paracoccidioides brasiliensis Pb18]EEH45862.2 hypothetical protein PADG_02012 [Paracoccidioides brasiliensis Pb18]